MAAACLQEIWKHRTFKVYMDKHWRWWRPKRNYPWLIKFVSFRDTGTPGTWLLSCQIKPGCTVACKYQRGWESGVWLEHYQNYWGGMLVLFAWFWQGWFVVFDDRPLRNFDHLLRKQIKERKLKKRECCISFFAFGLLKLQTGILAALLKFLPI